MDQQGVNEAVFGGIRPTELVHIGAFKPPIYAGPDKGQHICPDNLDTSCNDGTGRQHMQEMCKAMSYYYVAL